MPACPIARLNESANSPAIIILIAALIRLGVSTSGRTSSSPTRASRPSGRDLVIGSGGREAGVHRGWPESGARRSFGTGVREAGVHRGWPESGARRSLAVAKQAGGTNQQHQQHEQKWHAGGNRGQLERQQASHLSSPMAEADERKQVGERPGEADRKGDEQADHQ